MTSVGFVCAWCHRVRTSLGEWRLALPDEMEYPEATHGICPDCLARETRAALVTPPPTSLRLEERR
jgi:hypothetical protein